MDTLVQLPAQPPAGSGIRIVRSPNGVVKYQLRVAHKALGRPLYKNFDKLDDALEHKKLTLALIKGKGPLPDTILPPAKGMPAMMPLVREYIQHPNVRVSQSDKNYLYAFMSQWKANDWPISRITYEWLTEEFLVTLKRKKGRAPATITKYVGALSRLRRWAGKQYPSNLPIESPFDELKDAGSYSAHDVKALSSYHGRKVKVSEGKRNRRLEEGEEERIYAALDTFPVDNLNLHRYEQCEPAHITAQLKLMFVLGCNTAMRMAETYSLDRTEVNLKHVTVHLDKTKNGDERDVPLSKNCVAALKEYMAAYPCHLLFPSMYLPWMDDETEEDWNKRLAVISKRQSRMWQCVFRHAGVKGLHYHDLRHESTCRLYERTLMRDVEIMKVTGHRDAKMLLRYANLRAKDLAVMMW
jgi:integrase